MRSRERALAKCTQRESTPTVTMADPAIASKRFSWKFIEALSSTRMSDESARVSQPQFSTPPIRVGYEKRVDQASVGSNSRFLLRRRAHYVGGKCLNMSLMSF